MLVTKRKDMPTSDHGRQPKSMDYRVASSAIHSTVLTIWSLGDYVAEEVELTSCSFRINWLKP